MKKRFLFFCLLTSMSQICSANIIIDLSVKINYSIPMSISYPCGPSGCNFVLGQYNEYWMFIRNSLGQHLPFKMVAYNFEGIHYIMVKEAPSPNGIPGAGIVLPAGDCEEYGITNFQFLQLRTCEEDVIANIIFNIENNILTVSLGPNVDGLTLFKTDPLPPNQAMAIEGGPNHLSSDEGDTADRTTTTENQTVPSISPNPFSQSIKVQSNASETETISLQLLSSNGQSLHAQTYKGGQGEYPLSTENVPPGFYFLKVQVADRVQLHRVVKIE